MSEEKPKGELEEKATVKDYLTVEKEDDQELLKIFSCKGILDNWGIRKVT